MVGSHYLSVDRDRKADGTKLRTRKKGSKIVPTKIHIAGLQPKKARKEDKK